MESALMEFWEVYFKRNKEVVWRTLGDDCILLHLESGIYYTLNEEGRMPNTEWAYDTGR